MPIRFFFEDLEYKVTQPLKTKRWLETVIEQHEKKLINLNFIFCSDQHLYNMNKFYLNHDTYTDIITFDNAEYEDEIEGDIFISVPRVEENATLFQKTFVNEMRRVLVHGVLHLLGQDDKTEELKKQMRIHEDEALLQF
jgi:probable rRNA maturation factor